MADIFISYSREDRPRVETLASALTAAGYSVWWDKQIAGGARFAAETEAELKAAKAVIVVWTKTSVGSHWVADEASAGRDTGRLLPISLDGTEPPLGFRQFQVLDFSQWKPGEATQFAELRAGLARLIEKPVGTAAHQTVKTADAAPAAPVAGQTVPTRTIMIGAFVAGALAVVGAIVMTAMAPRLKDAPLQSPRIAFFGITAVDKDDQAADIAGRATDQIFQSLNGQRVDLAARTETLGTPADQQFARAEALKARFILAGQVKSDAALKKVNVTLRLEDVATRATLWEETVVNPIDAPLAAAGQAAMRAGDTTQCVARLYQRLARATREADMPVTLASYCARTRGQPTPEAMGAARRLAQLAPNDAQILSTFALELLSQGAYVDTTASAALFAEAERALDRADAAEPGNFTGAYGRFWLGALRGRPLLELDSYLQAALQRVPKNDEESLGYQRLNGLQAGVLEQTGRLAEAVPLFVKASAAQPFHIALKAFLADALVMTKRPEAEAALEEVGRLWGDPLYFLSRQSYAVLYGVGDADRLLAAPRDPELAASVQCLRMIQSALKTRDAKLRTDAAAKVEACAQGFDILPNEAVVALVRLDAVDRALAFVESKSVGTFFRPFRVDGGGPTIFFVSETRAMRADPRFLPLMEKFGLMDFWRKTKTQPDVCATEPAPFCLALKQAAGTK